MSTRPMSCLFSRMGVPPCRPPPSCAPQAHHPHVHMLTHHPHGAQAVDELVQPPLLPTYRVLQIRPLLRTLKQEGGGREYWG